jgi:hypothetical protein
MLIELPGQSMGIGVAAKPGVTSAECVRRVLLLREATEC